MPIRRASRSLPQLLDVPRQAGIYLEDLFVKPAFRGKGIGRELLVHIARLAVERGCGRMEWSVLNWNEPSIGFYKSLGAIAKDEWTVYRLTGESLQTLASSNQKNLAKPGTDGTFPD